MSLPTILSPDNVVANIKQLNGLLISLNGAVTDVLNSIENEVRVQSVRTAQEDIKNGFSYVSLFCLHL